MRSCWSIEEAALGFAYDGELWESELMGVRIQSCLVVKRQESSDPEWRFEYPARPHFLLDFDDVEPWARANCPGDEPFFFRALPALTLLSSAGATSIVDLDRDCALRGLNLRTFGKYLVLGTPLSRIFSALRPESACWDVRPDLLQIVAQRHYWDPNYLEDLRTQVEPNWHGYFHDDLGVMISDEYTPYDARMVKKTLQSFKRRNGTESREASHANYQRLWEEHQPRVKAVPVVDRRVAEMRPSRFPRLAAWWAGEE